MLPLNMLLALCLVASISPAKAKEPRSLITLTAQGFQISGFSKRTNSAGSVYYECKQSWCEKGSLMSIRLQGRTEPYTAAENRGLASSIAEGAVRAGVADRSKIKFCKRFSEGPVTMGHCDLALVPKSNSHPVYISGFFAMNGWVYTTVSSALTLDRARENSEIMFLALLQSTAKRPSRGAKASQ